MTNEINRLRAEVRRLEQEERRKQEKKALEKKIKQIKFRGTTFGKVTGGIAKVGEVFTRPAQKTKEGKVIAGTGGIGAKLMQVVSKMGQPKPMPKRIAPAGAVAPMKRTVTPARAVIPTSPMEVAFATPTAIPQPMKKTKAEKPFDINEVLKRLPQ